MTVFLSPIGGVASQFFDNNGNVLTGGKIYTYAAGTTTPQVTYTSVSGSTAHTNPIILDSAGRVPGGQTWLENNILYKFAVKTSTDVLIGTYDNVQGINNANASQISYTPAGTGAVETTVQTKLRQLVTPEDFGAVGDGVTDDGPAFVAACNYCCLTGATLWCSPKVYHKARVEVHETYCVAGNGATVMYLGIGQTIVGGSGTGTAANPAPWHLDPGYQPFYPQTTQYTLAIAPPKSSTTLTLTSVAGITVGMYMFLCGNPSSMSSGQPNPVDGNFIPRDFEFVRVNSINSGTNTITLDCPTFSDYLTTQSGLFYAPGLAIACSVRDLQINTKTDAYQHVVRSSYNCLLENITFVGTNAGGAATFSEGLVYENIQFNGTGNAGLSTGRGTVSATFNNVNLKSYILTTPQGGFFCEESFYKVTLNNWTSTASFAVGSMDCTGSQRKRILTLNNCIFNPSIYGGSYPPFAVSSCAGADINAVNCIFQGACTTLDPTAYPGITGQTLVVWASNTSTDTMTFANCEFISSNVGPTWPVAASSFQGTVRFDNLCTYTNSTAPVQIVPSTIEGTWTPVLTGSSTAGTFTYTSQNGSFVRAGNLVVVTFAVTWSAIGTAAGNVNINVLPFTISALNYGVGTVYDNALTASAVAFQTGDTRLNTYQAVTATGAVYGVISYML